MFKLKAFGLLFVCAVFVLSLFCFVPRVSAQSAAEGLRAEIKEFFAAGAEGYIVWQYSGNKGNGEIFASDPYAFFQGTPDGEAICKVLKEEAAANAGKFVGVNMWDAGGGAHSGAKITKHLKWLHDSCGVTVVRIFAKAGETNGVEKVLNAADGTGVQILVAIGDYSNGGGGIPSGVGSEWFAETVAAFKAKNGSNEFYKLASGVASLKGKSTFWGVEVANEIHCRGDADAIVNYKNVGAELAKLFGGRVGFGQKASENTTLCDSPGPLWDGKPHFTYTNDAPGVNISSGHYYNPAEKALALEALKQALAQGDTYYIGEAPPKLNASSDGKNGAPSNYQTVPYNFDEYYIHPIKGLEPRNKDVMRDDLIKQGYEARCAAPGFKIVLDQQGVDAMRDYLKCGPRGCNSPGGNGGVVGGIGIDGAPDKLGDNPLSERVVSLLKVDYRDALVPVLRDMNRLPQLKRSLEDYYGHKEGQSADYNTAELRSGAINSLLTSNQRCVQSALSLLQREVMCEKLENPDTCALYAAEIPQTTLLAKDLLAKYKAYSADSADHVANCTAIVAGPDNELRRGMLNTPLQIQQAYRLAFLVTTIRTRVPTPGTMMSLFQHPKRGPFNVGPDPKHVVLITAFKVPDIMTNKDIALEGESGDTAFNDPGLLTRDVLIPTHIQKDLNEARMAERKHLLDMGRQVSTMPQDDGTMAIECQLSGVGGYQCLDTTTAAVVDLINAQSLIENENEAALDSGAIKEEDLTSTELEQLFKLDCDATPGEEVDYILDPATLQPINNAGRIFKTDWGVAILENLFTDQTHMLDENSPIDPSYADTNSKKSKDIQWHWGLKSVFYVTANNKGSFGKFDEEEDARQVHQYIVYPAGYDMKTIEAVMSGTFFSSNQIDALKEKSKDYERLLLDQDKVTFEGGEASHTFEDQTDCDEDTYIDANGIPQTQVTCKQKGFGFKLELDEEPEHSGVLGGRLGYWTHTIQLQLQRVGSLTHKYLENCKTTEEFLLDMCGGESVSQVAVGTSVPAELAGISSFQIQYWSGANTVFQPPSQELWNAIIAASNKYGCDPLLMVAIAHSESQSYTNHTNPNGVGALGVFQFIEISWKDWWTKPYIAGPNNCSYMQPPNFVVPSTLPSRTDITASADAACRLLLFNGMQDYPDDKAAFIREFAQKPPVWNQYVPQADYVWRLWKELATRSGKTQMKQPSTYNYCS